MDKIIHEFLEISKKDSKAEFECSILPGLIQTKDVADRIQKCIQTISLGSFTETCMLRTSYPQNIRVEVQTPQLIQKVCMSSSFKAIPLKVEKKNLYPISNNTLDYTERYTRFRLREEEVIRRDWDASPNDKRVEMIRLINRRTYKSIDELFHIDFSMIKSRKTGQTLKDVLKEPPGYELEIEFVKRDTKLSNKEIQECLFRLIDSLVKSFQESDFILGPMERDKYIQEFRASRLNFYSPVTLMRRNLVESESWSIWKDYSVTIKADGARYGLYVAKNKKVLRIAFRTNIPVWTGLTATEEYVGDFIDGEFIKPNLFLIFDVYRHKGKDITDLPLMGEQSRLNCAKKFVEATKTFLMEPGNPIRIETKKFLAGDGPVMESAIKEILEAQYEYETDGLVFTPKHSGLAPIAERDRNVWTTVYKWKPPQQNSIDFLLRMSDETYDPVLDSRVRKGSLYIGRRPTDSILYPCETLTGEFVHEKLPEDLSALGTEKYVPALFQPSNPKNPDAYKISVPLDEKGLPYDSEGHRVEDNTIIECSYNLEKQRWIIMRTRYDKTYKYRVKNEPEFGNERQVADNIWSSIHIPIAEETLKQFASVPIDISQEDEIYYKEDLDRNARILQPCYTFHLGIKDSLYSKSLTKNQTLLEFGVGKGGDFSRWKRNLVSKVVGVDPAESGLKEACSRYLKDQEIHPADYRPKMLLVRGTMTEPLYDQESPKFKILNGEEKGTTMYLAAFEGLKKFDSSSSQFNIHYACESEEIFRTFVQNVVLHTKKTFFGTCMDGQSVYSLLVGKDSHIFTDGRNVGGEFTKKYEDKELWSEEFGMEIVVALESFDKPQKEYLVPFKKVQEIFQENGFHLKESVLFSELYTQQQKVLTPEQQSYSFLHRTFIFEREPEPESKKEPEAKFIPNDDAVPKLEEKPKRKLKKKGGSTEVQEPILFHAAGEDKGPYRTFSNMAEYPIQIEDKRYPTVEHYFQAEKARTFNDKEILEKILETPSAKAVKALGKKVKNFIKEKWDSDRLDIMKRAVRAKFVQHPELHKQLMETGHKPIGDADARDLFWGIGTSENTDKSKNPEKWKGQNQLGKILMSLRAELSN
jgi:ribA/ribD-fused uncharacterized protein